VDGALPATCAPASGSVFPIGVTTVQGKDLNNDGVIDWTVTGDLTLNIDADARKKRDRTYTITIKCTDAAGNKGRDLLLIRPERIFHAPPALWTRARPVGELLVDVREGRRGAGVSRWDRRLAVCLR
jgi:hypothetical protein